MKRFVNHVNLVQQGGSKLQIKSTINLPSCICLRNILSRKIGRVWYAAYPKDKAAGLFSPRRTSIRHEIVMIETPVSKRIYGLFGLLCMGSLLLFACNTRSQDQTSIRDETADTAFQNEWVMEGFNPQRTRATLSLIHI